MSGTKLDFAAAGLDTVLFLGAGASRALDLPTMAEFLARIAPGGDLAKLQRYGGRDVGSLAYQGVLRTVGILYPDIDPVVPGSADLERILGWMDSVCQFAESDQEGLSALLSASHVAGGTVETWQHAAEVVRQARQAAKDGADRCMQWVPEARRYLRSMLWHTYSSLDPERSRGLYYPLLRGLWEGFDPRAICPLAIFTTNYDRAIESLGGWNDVGRAIDADLMGRTVHGPQSAAIAIADGFNPSSRIWDPELLSRQILAPSGIWRYSSTSIAYFKLHGSLDWRARAGGVVTTDIEEEPIDSSDEPCLVYPGSHDEPEAEPYATAHRALADCLLVAKQCICVGFAFRSPTIAKVFSDTLELNPRLKLWMVDPRGSDVASRNPDHRRLWEHARTERVEEPFDREFAETLAPVLHVFGQ